MKRLFILFIILVSLLPAAYADRTILIPDTKEVYASVSLDQVGSGTATILIPELGIRQSFGFHKALHARTFIDVPADSHGQYLAQVVVDDGKKRYIRFSVVDIW